MYLIFFDNNDIATKKNLPEEAIKPMKILKHWRIENILQHYLQEEMRCYAI